MLSRCNRPLNKATSMKLVDHPDTPQEQLAVLSSSEEVAAVVSEIKSKTIAVVSDRNPNSSARSFEVLLDKITPEVGSPAINIDELSSKDCRYTGKNPMQAAKKAFTRICKASSVDNCAYIFTIQESTAGKTNKMFIYRGVREKLDKPLDVSKGDSSFQVNFSTTVRSYRFNVGADIISKIPANDTSTTTSGEHEKTSTPSIVSETTSNDTCKVPSEPEQIQVSEKNVPLRRRNTATK